MSDLLTDQEKRRCEARLKAYQCYILNERQIAAAMTAFEKEWNSVQDPKFGEVFTDVRKLILRAVEKLESKFTLRTLTPPGPAEKITKQIILEAADIVAAGYMQDCYAEVNGKRYHFVEHRFFTSIKQAVLHNKRLADILEKHDTTPKYLAAKFRKHCTGLHYHRLRMRCALTAKQMESRVTYCKEMLRVLELDPDFLRDIHWMDECTIWIGKDLISEKLHVWSYRSDTDGMAPEPNELFKSGKSFKVNLLLVVNARTGCTHAEVLTGTAGIRPADRYTTGMQHVMAQRSMMLGNPTYKVITSRQSS